MVFLQAIAGSVNATTAAEGKPPLVMLLTCGVCTKKGGEGKFLVVSDGCTDPIHKDVAAALDARGGVRAVAVGCKHHPCSKLDLCVRGSKCMCAQGKGGTMQGKSPSLTPEKIEAAALLLVSRLTHTAMHFIR
jgi:hypothetical protein